MTTGRACRRSPLFRFFPWICPVLSARSSWSPCSGNSWLAPHPNPRPSPMSPRLRCRQTRCPWRLHRCRWRPSLPPRRPGRHGPAPRQWRQSPWSFVATTDCSLPHPAAPVPSEVPPALSTSRMRPPPKWCRSCCVTCSRWTTSSIRPCPAPSRSSRARPSAPTKPSTCLKARCRSTAWSWRAIHAAPTTSARPSRCAPSSRRRAWPVPAPWRRATAPSSSRCNIWGPMKWPPSCGPWCPPTPSCASTPCATSSSCAAPVPKPKAGSTSSTPLT